MGPQRPVEHVLETKSQHEFGRVVPVEWVVRDVTPDYGIDREVEIFEDGVSTGLMFKVQLKSSAKTASGGPSRRVKTETLGYWKSLDVPVLIAYYAADSGALYGRWAHTVGREPGFDRDAKTTTVRFSEDERLTPEFVRDELPRDVAMVRELRTGRLPRPLPVRLTVQEGAVRGLSVAQVTVRLRQAIRERGLDRDVMLMRPGEEGPAVEVSLTVDDDLVLRAALPSDLATVRVVLPSDLYGPSDVGGLVADDVLVAVAFVVERTGAGGVAARLLQASAPGSVLAALPDVVLPISAVLAEQGLARTAQRLALRQWRSDDPEGRDIGDRYYTAIVHQIDGLQPDERTELIEAMRRRAAAELAASLPRRAGRAFYNLAQVLNPRWTPEALDAMDRALEHDPGYGQRDYFYRERGGMRWQIGRYLEAAQDYRRALDLSGDAGELVPLLADTLLYAGHYLEAAQVLEQWTPTGHHLDGLARLIRVAVAEVRAVTGLDAQDRDPAGLAEIEVLDSDGLLALLARTDALDPRIWLRLVDEQSQLPRLILVALMALNSAQAWAVATVAAMDPSVSTDPELVSALIEAGNRLSETSYTDAVDQVLGDLADDAEASAIRNAVYDDVERLDNAPPATTSRLVFE